MKNYYLLLSTLRYEVMCTVRKTNCHQPCVCRRLILHAHPCGLRYCVHRARRGVSENVMVGNLAPCGTGAFDLVRSAVRIHVNGRQMRVNIMRGLDFSRFFLPDFFNPDFSHLSPFTFHLSPFTPGAVATFTLPFAFYLFPHSQITHILNLSSSFHAHSRRCSTRSWCAAPCPVSITRWRTCRPISTSMRRAPRPPAGRRRSGRAAPALARVRLGWGGGGCWMRGGQ
jgi:hypothetical protein